MTVPQAKHQHHPQFTDGEVEAQGSQCLLSTVMNGRELGPEPGWPASRDCPLGTAVLTGMVTMTPLCRVPEAQGWGLLVRSREPGRARTSTRADLSLCPPTWT